MADNSKERDKVLLRMLKTRPEPKADKHVALPHKQTATQKRRLLKPSKPQVGTKKPPLGG